MGTRLFLPRLPPSVIALAIQFVSALGAVACTAIPGHGTSIHFEAFEFAVLQGLIAVSLSYLAGLAPWWLGIQMTFLPGAIGLQLVGLPSSVFLIGFLALLGVFWSTFRTQVPLYLSDISVWRAVQALLPAQSPIKLIDVGSGLGGLLFYLNRVLPQGEYAGIEIAPLPWLLSRIRAAFGNSSCRIHYGNYDRIDFAAFDVVFAYLSPAAMVGVWNKTSNEMRPGTLFLSCEFAVPGVAPDMAIALPGRRQRILYGWRI